MKKLRSIRDRMRLDAEEWIWDHLKKAELQDWIGQGWHRVEFKSESSWVWSLGKADLKIPSGAQLIALRVQSNHALWTGRPQHLRLVLDGEPYRDVEAREGCNTLFIPCRNRSTLTIEADTARPCDYLKSSETRQLGVCLLEFRYYGRKSASTAEVEQKVSAIPEATPNCPPHTLQVEITASCHLRCKMCARSPAALSGRLQMSGEIWDRFMEIARSVECVNFLGNGEPFTHPRFLSCLSNLDEIGVRTHFTTSGDLIDQSKAEQLAKLRHLAKITLSIDSPEPAAYEAVRGIPLSRVAAALDRLVGLLDHPEEQVRVFGVVMKSNMDSMLGFPEFLKKHGVRQFALRGMVDLKGIPHEVPDFGERDRAILRRVKTECEHAGIKVSLLPPIPVDFISVSTEDLRDERFDVGGQDSTATKGSQEPSLIPQTRLCFDPWEMAMITHEGLVYPCEVYHAMEPMGSLFNETFEQIWTGERWNALRRQLLAGRSTACFSCPRRHIGEHPFQRFAASIDSGRSMLSGPRRTLAVRNTGRVVWDSHTQLVIGTSRPKDRLGSAFHDPSWIKSNRVASFRENAVAPGETATFEFDVNPLPTHGLS